MQFSFFNFDRDEKCYIDLCQSCLKSDVIHKWEDNGNYKNVDSIVTRVILENTFNIGMCDFRSYRRSNSFSAVIDFKSVDRPLFFYIGIKSLPFKKKVVKEMMNVKIEDYNKLDATGFAKLCCYVIACPYEMLNKINTHKQTQAMNEQCVKMNDMMCNKYNVTLFVLNYLVSKYVLHMKPRKIIDGTGDKCVSISDFDMLVQTCDNEIVHKICMKGVEFCKSVFKEYRLHYCGRLLFNIVTTDNAMYGFNVQNLNSNFKLSTKIGLENFKIVIDKHNLSLDLQDRCWKNVWNFEFVMMSKYFNGMLRSTAIMPLAEYLTIDRDDDCAVAIPAMKARIRSVIDVDEIDRAVLRRRREQNTRVPEKYYKYVSMLVSFSSGTVESIMYASVLHNICKIKSLNPMMCMYVNNLYVFYELPAECEVIDQNKINLYEPSETLMFNTLRAYAFIYVLGWNCLQFAPFRCYEDVYTDGLYLRVEDNKMPIILKNNAIYVKGLLEEKYMTRLMTCFNEWINKLVKNKVIPPTIIMLIVNRIMRLYELKTWIT